MDGITTKRGSSSISGREGGSGGGSGSARVCPTTDGHMENERVRGVVVAKPATTNGKDDHEELPEDEDGDRFSDHGISSSSSSSSSRSSEEEGGEFSDTDDTSDGAFSLDMDVVDDVTSDEGFELGEVRLLPIVTLYLGRRGRERKGGMGVSKWWLSSKQNVYPALAGNRNRHTVNIPGCGLGNARGHVEKDRSAGECGRITFYTRFAFFKNLENNFVVPK